MESKKINVAELLKDCPPGMELDCKIFDGVVLKEVIFDYVCDYPITITTKEGETWALTSKGCWHDRPSAKCVIFPKGKTTWEGFVPPGKFKDGDIISDSLDTCIFKGEGVVQGTVDFYCGVHGDYFNVKQKTNGHYGNIVDYRLATEEEKQKLFQAIKDNGYRWNAETKTLEKLVEPKFKVGDKVVRKDGVCVPVLITKVGDEFYKVSNDENSVGVFRINDQDSYELVPDKFDINNLKPFDEVLVRNTDNGHWWGQFYMSYNKTEDYPFKCTYNCWKQCIPYAGNEHLLDKTDDCSEYYKTW